MDDSDESAGANPPQSIDGASSHGRRKRGRPPSQLSTANVAKERKRKIDKESRLENREVLEGFTKITPTLKELIQLVESCNLKELLQRIPNIEDDAIERFKKVVPLLLQLVELGGQCNLGELLPNERPNLIQTIQQKKDPRMEIESFLQLVQEKGQDLTHSTQELKILIDGLKEVAPVISQIRECNTTVVMKNGQDFMQTAPGMVEQQNGQNFMQTAPGMVEQQNNENDATANFCDSFIIDGCGNGSNVDLLMEPSSSCYFGEGVISESSDQNGESFDDEQVKTFIEQCDGNVKRQVTCADFYGLEEELNKVERNVFPPFLSPIAEKIKAKCGDITEHSTQSNNAAYPTCIMFYAAMKEMDELKELKDVSITKLRVWRDAILDALQINFNVQVAKVHLMRIASAYFGLKAYDAKLYERKRSLLAELNVLENNLQVREECQAQTRFFSDKPLNTGLFP